MVDIQGTMGTHRIYTSRNREYHSRIWMWVKEVQHRIAQRDEM